MTRPRDEFVDGTVLLHHKILFIKTKCNFYYLLHRNFLFIFFFLLNFLFAARLFHFFYSFVGFFCGAFNQFQFYSMLQKRNSLLKEKKGKFYLRILKLNQKWKDFSQLSNFERFFFCLLTKRSETAIITIHFYSWFVLCMKGWSNNLFYVAVSSVISCLIIIIMVTTTTIKFKHLSSSFQV